MRIGYLWPDRRPAVSLTELLMPLTPAVQLDDEGPGIWFDASGVRLHFGDEQRYGRAVLAALAAAGGAGRLGIAATPWVARLAARTADPDEVLLVPDHETRAFVRPLPLDWLPLPQRVRVRLRALGFTTIGQFADLPPESVRRRFGAEALVAHRLARGDDPSSFRGRVPVEPIRCLRTLEPPVATSEQLVAALDALAEEAAAALARCEQVAWHLRVELVTESGRSEPRERRLPRPLRTATEIAAAARALALRHPPHAPVIAVHLLLRELELAGAGQALLLAAAPTRRAERERVWQLAQRQARGRVIRVVEHRPAAPLPEHRWLVEGSVTPDTHPARGEPIRLLQREHGWWLELAGRWLRIVRSGPWERLDLWWPEELHRRTRWVELTDGQRLLLTWDARDRLWRLVGRLD
ncbi:MAG: hypothetical protein RMH81_09155 [Thermomicrobium sp.]|nr:hypothetical protein [Thermomicrobium sp.]